MIKFNQEVSLDAHRGSGWVITEYPKSNCILATKESTGRHNITSYIYKIWVGKRRDASYKSSAGSLSDRNEEVSKILHNLQKRQNLKKKKIVAKDYFSLGDVLVYSWGYDQTNVDYFQVTKVLAATIKIREIAVANSDHGGPTGGRCQPKRYQFLDDSEEQLKKISLTQDGRPYVTFRSGIGTKWDGTSNYTSSYH